MTSKIPYDKPPCPDTELLQQLRNRGLDIEDETRTIRYLNFIGYYRLSAYFLPYQSEKDKFRDGVEFDRILSLYIFDRKLKLTLMEAIERIEVAVRAATTNYMSLRTGDAHWFLNENHFDNYSPDKGKSFQSFDGYLQSICSSIDRQIDATPIVHYYSKYSFPDYPPGWVVMEVLTLGQVSKIYSILRTKYKRKIAKKFKTSWQVLEAILLSLTVIRNKCAHHQRVWNVKISYPPARTVLKNIAPQYSGSPNSPCVIYFMIWFILTRINNDSNWGARLCEQLLELDESLLHKIGLDLNEIYTYLIEE
ncbi:Abi family protein [Desulfobacter hydrogenophilus]|uniref:Abi family protein n=1 Tax=Desulfobacter hydrogenophilus TaxID=2291 RepID=UPI0013D64F54|nr:Abi family protein [Desulfobacter hydrogenophilus]NDY73100.1 Abi family protein [Desulfobacter hydrogenophilus]